MHDLTADQPTEHVHAVRQGRSGRLLRRRQDRDAPGGDSHHHQRDRRRRRQRRPRLRRQDARRGHRLPEGEGDEGDGGGPAHEDGDRLHGDKIVLFDQLRQAERRGDEDRRRHLRPRQGGWRQRGDAPLRSASARARAARRRRTRTPRSSTCAAQERAPTSPPSSSARRSSRDSSWRAAGSPTAPTRTFAWR